MVVHVDAEPQVTEKQKGFLRADKVCVSEQRHCAGYFVIEHTAVSPEEFFSGFVFVLNNFGDDGLFKLFDYFLLADSECDLV